LEWLGNFFSRCFQEQPDRSREPIEIIIIIIIMITNEVLPSLSLMSYTTPPLKREREEKKVKKQKKEEVEHWPSKRDAADPIIQLLYTRAAAAYC
jgi:hypothetical protein